MRSVVFCLLLFPAVSWAEEPDGFVRTGWLRGERFSHASSLQLHLKDDVQLTFGNTRSASDAQLEWDTDAAAHNFRLTLTNVDGVGTDGIIWWAKEGEPYLYLGDTDQAIRLDPSTDNQLTLNTESGGGVRLDLGGTTGVLSFGDNHGVFVSGGKLVLSASGGNEVTVDSDGNMIVLSSINIGVSIAAGAPSFPVVCTSSTVGTIVYMDDTTDSSPPSWCGCQSQGDDGAGTVTGVEYRDLSDPINTACPFGAGT